MNQIEAIVCFYGGGSLEGRSLLDCTCQYCINNWIAVAPIEINHNQDDFECPYCGKDNCTSELRVASD